MQTGLDFWSALVLKDHFKWKANKNEHGEGDNTYLNVHSKSNNNEEKIHLSWNPSLQEKLCQWSLKRGKKQSCEFIWT